MLSLRGLFLGPLILLCAYVSAQEFRKVYGGSLIEEGYGVLEAQNGDLLVTGITDSYGPIDTTNGLARNLFLIRLQSDGDTIWTRTFFDQTVDTGRDIVEMPNGDIAVLGTKSIGSLAVAMFDAAGELQWTTTVPGLIPRDIEVTTDSGLIVLAAHDPLFNNDVHLQKLSSDGLIEWTETYQLGTLDPHDLVVHDNGSLFICGGTGVGGSADFFLLMVDANGVFENIFFHDTPNLTDIAYSLCVAGSGNIVLTGARDDVNFERALIVSFDPLGNFLWEQEILGPFGTHSGFRVVRALPDGYVCAGFHIDTTNYKPSVWLLKTDFVGDEIWSRPIELQSGPEVWYTSFTWDMEICSDGGFVVTGRVDLAAPNPGDRQLFILKTDGNGIINSIDTHSVSIEKEITAFPNPFESEIMVSGIEDFEFEFFDLRGTSIHSGSSIGNRISELSEFGSGLYILRLAKGELNIILRISKL